MLLMFEQVDNFLPMTILNVITGKTIMDFCYKKTNHSDFEFLEQFNEKLLVKYRNQPLKIKDTLTQNTVKVPDFETPEAFIFVYERETFLSLKEGKIKQYSIDGTLLSDFGDHHIFSFEQEAEFHSQESVHSNVY
mmetsp:Transcript_19382/g.29735  ORF Transcript_19382/g.29735 Transcript_19382/m.29735 type:complete len:135 (+) Transcript_19382:867-1271(+)